MQKQERDKPKNLEKSPIIKLPKGYTVKCNHTPKKEYTGYKTFHGMRCTKCRIWLSDMKEDVNVK